MSIRFSFIAPSNAYYEKPYNKDALLISFDDKKKTIFSESLSIRGGIRNVVKNKYQVNKDKVASFMEYLKKEERFFRQYALAYKATDGADYLHGIMRYEKILIHAPDFLLNFGDYDIFARYRYYPDRDKVHFYEILRAIYRFVWDNIGYPEDIAIFDRPPLAILSQAYSNPLSFNDFDPWPER